MVGRIIGIIISLVMIIGGFSGALVLKGTNSSTALVIIGFLILAYEIFRIMLDKKKNGKDAEE